MIIKKIERMYIISFLFSIHIALSAYVNSTFLSEIIPEKFIGILFTTSSLIALILLTRSYKILGYFGNRKTIIYFLSLNALALIILAFSRDSALIALAFILFSSTNSLIFLSLDIFIEHFGCSKNIGKTRGIYLTTISIAWMLSPFISSFIISELGGYKYIYILSFILSILMIIGMKFSIKVFKDRIYKKVNFFEAYEYLKVNSHMLAITSINFLLQFFYALMVIYTPLYLINHIGLGWAELGIIFTIMLSPFVLLSFPIGILIDKYKVKKRTLITLGLLTMSSSVFLISEVTTQSIVVWSLLLFLTRMGASMVESTSEIYFFTHIKEEDAFLLGLYRDMSPVAYILAPLLATILFLYLPFNFIFVALSIILLVGLYYVPKLKRNHDQPISN